jgi:ribosomal-protein-alanine N-acetyltransferase
LQSGLHNIKMELLPIEERLESNEPFINDPLCRESLYATIDFYKKIGFVPPWIGYYAKENNELVGCAGFKGQPVNGMIEIAYGAFEQYRKQGVGTKICKLLVGLALKADPAVKITARTLPENNFSTRILEKNNFTLAGTVNDPDDGEVWEWIFKAGK